MTAEDFINSACTITGRRCCEYVVKKYGAEIQDYSKLDHEFETIWYENNNNPIFWRLYNNENVETYVDYIMDLYWKKINAPVSELADDVDLKFTVERRPGSSPGGGTNDN